MALQEEFEIQGNWLFRYRGVLPIIVLSIGAIMYVRTEMYPETFILEGTRFEVYYELFCLLIGLVGLSIRAYTVGHTPDNTSGRNTTEQLADSLNFTGIYSIVRHPLYLGNFLMWLAPAMLPGQFWFVIAFCLSYWVYYERIMFAEEQFLRRKFGEAYILWAEKTPAFLPRFKQFAPSSYPFSWKKVLKKEKNGLLALLFIFTLFDVSGTLIENSRKFNYYMIGACGISLIMYGVLKYMKKNTTLLNDNR